MRVSGKSKSRVRTSYVVAHQVPFVEGISKTPEWEALSEGMGRDVNSPDKQTLYTKLRGGAGEMALGAQREDRRWRHLVSRGGRRPSEVQTCFS